MFHKGGLARGHFWVVVDHDAGCMTTYDDEKVRSATSQDTCQKAVYMALYVRNQMLGESAEREPELPTETTTPPPK